MKIPLSILRLLSLAPAVSYLDSPRDSPTPDDSALLALHKALCTIPSISGSEFEVVSYLTDYLTSRNFTVEHIPVSPNRSNIYAYLSTTRRTRTLITSHIDVVPPYIPYTFYPNGTIVGRGTNDAKGSVAAQILAVEELISTGDIAEGDVAFLYVVGEETGGDGMRAANDLNLTWSSVIFGEPTENRLSVGHKGALMFSVEAIGKAAHSGYPQLGINANVELVDALYALNKLELPSSELLGNSTLNFGVMGGGVAPNIISPFASANVSVRVAAEMEEIRRRVDAALGGVEGVRWSYAEAGYGPVLLDYDVEGFETEAQSYGTDIPYLRGNHKKYLYGPGSIFTAHSDAEFVLASDLEEAVRGYKLLLKHTLGK
ncbi:hypothetical protein RUND412_004176 [Rhizina undulata]